MSEMSPQALSDRLRQDEDPLVLDVREPSDVDGWHVPESVNVPVYDDLDEDPESARERLRDLPRDRDIVTVCAFGKRSAEATAILREEGYDASTLVGGMTGWNRVHWSAPIDVDLDGTLVQVARPGTGCLSHVLVSDGEAAVFDPSSYHEEYEAILDEYDADLVAVFDSHAHADHVSGGRTLAARHDVPYYRHPADVVDDVLDDEFDDADDSIAPLADGDELPIGDATVEVLHTPGHSPGSVSFGLAGNVLLTGDTLFHESVGRVELGVTAGLEDATVADNAERLFESIERLRAYGSDPLVLPAHDPHIPEPPVTARMNEIEATNPGLSRDREAFVAALVGDVPDHPPNFERIKRINVGAARLGADESVDDLEQGPNNCAAE